MKLILCILPLSFTWAFAQFGGFRPPQFGQQGNGVVGQLAVPAINLSQRLNNVTSRLKELPLVGDVKDFADFVQQTGKTYASAAERELRENIFKTRVALVDANNKAFAAGILTYESAINVFSDHTLIEFLKQLTGYRKSAQREKAPKENSQKDVPIAGKIPDSFDWRQKGGVTPVKFQGKCASCWAFASTGAIEGHNFRKNGKLINLSEQNLIDCGKEEFGLEGCIGGFQEYAFEFVVKQKGVAKAQLYPFLGKKDICRYKDAVKGAEIRSYSTIEPDDEETMKKVIATLGPLACSVNSVESLTLYKRGIYNDEECNKDDVNHSVLVVGYGSEKGNDYWIVKNSWSKVWGEDGYFRLPRGKNFCGIASECSYPIV